MCIRDSTLPWHSHLYCTVCGGVTDAEVDGKQVMELVKNQKGRVQDCAVVLLLSLIHIWRGLLRNQFYYKAAGLKCNNFL